MATLATGVTAVRPNSGSDDEATSSLPLYHLIPKATFEGLSNISEYLPPTYEQDGGFIHLTEDASVLLSVANQFYENTGRLPSFGIRSQEVAGHSKI